jgi:16S rRNA processing protein RimM
MKKQQLKKIGTFSKVHGVHGDLVLNLTDNITIDLIEHALNEGDAVFVEMDGIPVPFFISENGISERDPQTILVSLDEISDKKAIKLVQSKVYLEIDKMPEIEKDNHTNFKDVIGFSVVGELAGSLGTVSDFLDLKNNPMLSIRLEGKSWLLPLVSDFITRVDIEKQQMFVKLPNGYLDALMG